MATIVPARAKRKRLGKPRRAPDDLDTRLRKQKAAEARVHAFEAARHRTAGRVADEVLGRCLSFVAVAQNGAYQLFLDRILREEATLLRRGELTSDVQAYCVRQRLERALPAEHKSALARYEDWLVFRTASEAEAAYLVGFHLGRGGRR